MISKKRQPAATRIIHDKEIVATGLIVERVVYQLPAPTAERSHGYKYRLYCGTADGRCLVRYDNETGKGDHVHRGKQEQIYRFTSLMQLLSDFDQAVDQIIQEMNHE
jgi:hypothetical protein